MEINPDHTNTMVGTFPLLPINPLANGHNTQKLKSTPPTSLLHCGKVLYIVLDTPTAIAIMFIIIMVMGGTIRKLYFTTYRSTNSSSPSSGVPDFDVNVNEMSTPAITFKSPCITAAGCALVPPINQNCLFRHHSRRLIPDHLISRIARKQRVSVIISKNTRNVTFRVWTMNCPVNKETTGRKQ